MPNFYLQRNDGTVSDMANYPSQPDARSEGTWVEGLPPENATVFVSRTKNEQMQAAFQAMLPNHLGQSYCTTAVIKAVEDAKLEITDANELDPTGSMAKAILQSLSLPTEMQADQQTLLNTYYP